MITTVIFDLDDTLYNELDYCKSGFNAVSEFLAELFPGSSAENISVVIWEQFTNGNHQTTFNAALEKLKIGYDQELIRQLVKIYRNHIPQITLPEDSRSVLDELSACYSLALLTDGFLPAQKYKVKALGISDYFKCIVYTEEFGREYWKPSPVGFEKILKDLRTTPQNAVYVADNPVKDFIAPNKLGFSTIQLLRPARIHIKSPDQAEFEAKYTIDKINDLPSLLQQL
ncbi:MAG: HAD family hydrolase [Sedimentisphaerales bacterium]|nr:HAD family hydrolase [Sedimentisphaerales bacterium]